MPSKTKAKTKTTTKRPAAKSKTVKVAAPAVATRVRVEFAHTDGRPPIWRSCSTDLSRPVLLHPFLIQQGPPSKRRFFLCATDSYQLVKVEVRLFDDKDEPVKLVDDRLLGLIDVAAVKAWTKRSKKIIDPRLTLRVEGAELELHDPSPHTMNWPKPEGQPVGVTKLTASWIEDGLLEEYVVGFNPVILAKIAAALGADAGKEGSPLVLRFVRPKIGGGPMTVRPMIVTTPGAAGDSTKLRETDTFGVLMPVRVNG